MDKLNIFKGRILKNLICMLLFMIVSSCSMHNEEVKLKQQEPNKSISEAKKWSIKADIKLSVKYKNENNKEVIEDVSGYLFWSKSPYSELISIYNSVGLTFFDAEYIKELKQAEVTIDNYSEEAKTYKGATIQQALDKQETIKLPINNLRNWLLGFKNKKDKIIDINNVGRVVSLKYHTIKRTWLVKTKWQYRDRYIYPLELQIYTNNLVINIKEIKWSED